MSELFQAFVAKFPPVSMPITLGEDSHHVFGTENEPLSDKLIQAFILPLEEADPDEFTEYVPCFAIDNTETFVAVVWWKAALMNYEYVLSTYTLKGDIISREVIARTAVYDDKVHRSVAMINEEYEITIAEGDSPDGDQYFDPTSSRTKFMEILVNGVIVPG